MTALFRLRADAGMRLPASDAKWCALFPRGGWHHHTGGNIEFTDDLAAAFIASWKAAGSPPLPITLHHVPDDLSVVEKRTAGEAEGWIEDLRIGAGAIALEGAVKWTDPAKALIAADRYRYLSPEWSMQHIDRRTGAVGGPWLYGAALLNDPFFHSMPRVAASASPNPHAPTNAAQQAEEKHMSMQRIRAALSLAAGVGEEQVAEAVERLVAANTTATEKLTAATQATVKLTALEQTVEHLKAANAKTEAELVAMRAAKSKADVDALVAEALRDREVSDPLKASIEKMAETCGIEEARKLVASLPKAKKVGEQGIAGDANALGETPETAHQKLEARAKEIAKGGVKPSDARLKAFAEMPEHARLAARLNRNTIDRNTQEA